MCGEAEMCVSHTQNMRLDNKKVVTNIHICFIDSGRSLKRKSLKPFSLFKH